MYKQTRRIILASGSPRRKELLQKSGLTFEVLVTDANEQCQIKEPARLVCELAKRKVQAVLTKDFENCIIIAADTVVEIDNKILNKPTDFADAHKMLSMLSGRSHNVYTGVCVKLDDKIIVDFCKTKVHIQPLTNEQIDQYIQTDEPMDKAGAYAVQGLFAQHITGIEGCFYNVMGLPLNLLFNMLSSL